MSATSNTAARIPGGRIAVGHRRADGMITLAVHFDPDAFAQLRARAIKDHTSVGEQVRLATEIGLEELDKGDRP